MRRGRWWPKSARERMARAAPPAASSGATTAAGLRLRLSGCRVPGGRGGRSRRGSSRCGGETGGAVFRRVGCRRRGGRGSCRLRLRSRVRCRGARRGPRGVAPAVRRGGSAGTKPRVLRRAMARRAELLTRPRPPAGPLTGLFRLSGKAAMAAGAAALRDDRSSPRAEAVGPRSASASRTGPLNDSLRR